jgi:hypothetical protein
VADFLEDKRREINNRLAELKPLLDEYTRLEQAARALDGIPTSTNGVSAPSPSAQPKTGSGKRRGRPPGSKNKTTAAVSKTAKPTSRGRRGRRKGIGKRPAEALALIQEKPGITVAELAAEMKINQTYLYRVVPRLKDEGKVAKQGRGWIPKP